MYLLYVRDPEAKTEIEFTFTLDDFKGMLKFIEDCQDNSTQYLNYEIYLDS